MKLYKLTDQKNRTRAGKLYETVWGEGVTHSAVGTGTALCSCDVIHAYTSPDLAVLLNPAHAGIINPKLWEAEGNPIASKPDKVGVKTLTTIKEIPLPIFTITQSIAFAILAAKEVFKDQSFHSWADNWLSGQDRSRAAAYDARAAAWDAAWAAAAAAAVTDLDLQVLADKAKKY